MRAARFHEFGGPEVLRVEEVPWPHATGDELLVRVLATSVNGTDLHLRNARGAMALSVRRPFTPGFDFAGVVAAVGPKVTAFEPGDRVFGLLGMRAGAAAEYLTVSQDRVALAPTSLPATAAAAVPLAGLTALQALRGEAGEALTPGAEVLVHGAAGGIGAFAVLLAKHFGARVTATARASKLGFVRDLGADEAIDAGTLDLAALPGRFDVLLDSPPALAWETARGALRGNGVMVSTRPFPTTPGDARGFARGLVGGVVGGAGPRLRGVHTRARSADLAFLARLVDRGELRVPIDRVFPLTEIEAAHRALEGPDVRGKVVVEVTGG